MCGILFTNRDLSIFDMNYILEFLKNRGPDATSIKKINQYTFIHTLLNMTGPSTEQPFYNKDNTIICIYNGEIYNFEEFGDYKTDGECIIPLYELYGDDFVDYLDGEFAIILVDLNKNKLLFSTDIFSCRPLWVSFDNMELGISSYESCLIRCGFKNYFQIMANRTYIYDLKNLTCIKEQPVHTFDLKQYKDNFDDWNKAFTNSIIKRTKHAKCGIFIGLSAGYDSGTIACELKKNNIPFTPYSITNAEDPKIMEQRNDILKNVNLINITRDKFLEAREYLKKFSEEYKLNIDNGEKGKYFNLIKQNKIEESKKLLETIEFRKNGQFLTDDNGAIGCSYICSLAKNKGEKIYLSGSGADEIFSDYGYNKVRFFDHSSIAGYFTDNLNEIFPWKNFFGNTQRAYLMKEEYVAGSYGIEGRYPFLDKQVVQEFLCLLPELKNKNYKAPLHNYLIKNNFPFEINQKTGFGCGHAGPSNNNKSYETLSKTTIEQVKNRKVTDYIETRFVDFNNYIKKSYENHDFIIKNKIIKINDNLYGVDIDINFPGTKYNTNCNYYLLENNIPIGFANNNHRKIQKEGKGLFSFWTSKYLYFSSSDNSDPRINNKEYSIDCYCDYDKINVKYIIKINKNLYAYKINNKYSNINNELIKFYLIENKIVIGNITNNIEQIANEGNGLYYYENDILYFSTSDNTNPQYNSREYLLIPI